MISSPNVHNHEQREQYVWENFKSNLKGNIQKSYQILASRRSRQNQVQLLMPLRELALGKFWGHDEGQNATFWER